MPIEFVGPTQPGQPGLRPLNIHPVILCGGSGTRLWPLSRELEPKQFLTLLRGRSLLQDTVARLDDIPGLKPPLLIGNRQHQAIMSEQLRALGKKDFSLLIEPFGRGTAPAIAIAAGYLLRRDPDAALLVMPADHDIPDASALARAVDSGKAALAQERLVVFGLPPEKPETEFGYIERGESLTQDENCFAVTRFVEKPELEIACHFVDSGRHYWNSGIFLLGARHFLDELAQYEPEIAEFSRLIVDKLDPSAQQAHIDTDLFALCRDVSIDHAVFEHTRQAAMVCASFAWSDLGSWRVLWESADKDQAGNVAAGDVHLHSVRNCYVRAEHRMVVGIDLEDLIVVETGDALLIASRQESAQVKNVVHDLRRQDRDECRSQRRVRRPWGHYEDIDAGDRFRVKRITVNPGATLSLQLHHHRAEHWVVVRGTARVTCGEKIVLLSENESTYIPIGVIHRLENPGLIPLELIETQTGTYLKEDDIVRFEDIYQRV
jgi:mannose-1-phosphate guanylyltransferase/mannose-6-phosphate isomerase